MDLSLARRSLGAALAFGLSFGFSAGIAHAAGSVSWLSPANNSTATVGTVVSPTGQASGGISGGIGLDLVLVLDESGSMGWTAGLVQAQRDAAIALIQAVPQSTSSIAVLGFGQSGAGGGSQSRVLAPLQSATNQAALIAGVNTTVATGGTPTDEGILQGAALITGDNNGRSKQLVVITDGAPNSTTAAINAAAAVASGTPAVQVNTVGLPNTSFGNQQAIAAAGGGSFVTASNIQDLIDIFTGTSGNLVGIDEIDVTLPDGTLLADVPLTSGLGNFSVTQGYALQLGNNIWTVLAKFTDGTSATATLNVIGVQGGGGGTNPVPLPAAAWLLLSGFAGLGAMSRMRRRA